MSEPDLLNDLELDDEVICLLARLWLQDVIQEMRAAGVK